MVYLSLKKYQIRTENKKYGSVSIFWQVNTHRAENNWDAIAHTYTWWRLYISYNLNLGIIEH